MNLERPIAGIFSGIGALFLIYNGQTEAGIAILGAMMGFFIGEYNGQKKAEQTTNMETDNT